tara:strand:- start:679 stop:1746 length:1068 start_codon:yes stop_codon:yes gene_type:complete
MSIFYFKTSVIIKNIHKIILYSFLKYFQVYSKGNYKSFKYIGDPEYLKLVEEYIGIEASPESKKLDTETLLIIEKFSFKLVFKNIFKLNRVRIIDKHYFGLVAANTLFRVLYNDLTTKAEKQKIINDSLKNFNDLTSLIKNQENIFVLGNNEDFSNILEKYKPQYLFTCNSAINNESIFNSNLLILSFSDPLFHFGINDQAIEYRRRLKSVLENKKNIFLVVPIEGIPLLEKIGINQDLPIIGLDSTYFQFKVIKTRGRRLFTRNSHNVFTQYLLPVASLSEKLKNIGAVTFSSKKAFEENLWSHDEKIKETSNYNFAYDESFFGDRDFKKYYKFHDKQLNRLINKIKNKQIIKS